MYELVICIDTHRLAWLLLIAADTLTAKALLEELLVILSLRHAIVVECDSFALRTATERVSRRSYEGTTSTTI